MSETRLLLAARGLRATGDGFVSLLLPVYLLELGQVDGTWVGASQERTICCGLVARPV